MLRSAPERIISGVWRGRWDVFIIYANIQVYATYIHTYIHTLNAIASTSDNTGTLVSRNSPLGAINVRYSCYVFELSCSINSKRAIFESYHYCIQWAKYTYIHTLHYITLHYIHDLRVGLFHHHLHQDHYTTTFPFCPWPVLFKHLTTVCFPHGVAAPQTINTAIRSGPNPSRASLLSSCHAEMRYGVLAQSESWCDGVCVCERNRTSLHMACVSVIAELHRGGLAHQRRWATGKEKKTTI